MSKKIRIKRIKPAIKYVGSLIQQNHSEGLKHGLLVWNLNDKSSQFIQIQNDYCFYTLDIDNGKHLSYDHLPKNVHLRVRVKDTESDVVNLILADFKIKYNVVELVIQKTNDFAHKRSTSKKIDIGDIRDPENQNTLIYDYLKQKFNLDDTFLDGVRHINRKTNSSLVAADITRNIIWLPKKFEFSNMFSYGENNVVDFTNCKGTYGIFAPNASGKSTLLEALSYCIFDKCARAFKAVHVMNNKKDSFHCKFNFEIDGVDYFIEKSATRTKSGHVKVEIDFWYVNEAGDSIFLNGQERSDTNNIIRKHVGTYEDFILTSLSLQNNNTAFIDMSQKDRKDLLAQFLDINVFESLYNIANAESKDISVLIKEHKKTDYTGTVAKHENEIQTLNTTLIKLEQDKTKVDDLISELNDKIVSQSSLLKPIDVNVIDIQESLDNQQHYEDKSLECNTNLNLILGQREDLQEEINQLTGSLDAFNKTEIDNQLNEMNKVVTEKSSHESLLARLSTTYKHTKEKADKLDTLEYDPNCKFCMNNVFVKDAVDAKNKLNELELQVTELQNKVNEYDIKLKSYHVWTEQSKSYTSAIDIITRKNIALNSTNTKIQTMKTNCDTIDKSLEHIKKDIELYKQNEESIASNKIVQEVINELQTKKKQATDVSNALNKQIIQLNGNIQMHEANKQTALDAIQKLADLEIQYKYYQYYLEAVNRDGVPYHLISLAIPQIEQEINNILIPIVDFVIKLDTDGKNINAYIVYDNDSFWPIELTSGMERFLSSLAIRSALINVSSLPRPNFLAIDEGFGVLDSDKLISIYSLFNYLKTQFTSLMIISHIDSMRDVVDSLIEINKINSFSKIDFR
jgi:DNA repair exonuclease SbcCD ATPase subunit